MSSDKIALEKDNPFISLRNRHNFTQNFHLLSASDLFKDFPERPLLDDHLTGLFEEYFYAHIPKPLNTIPKILHVVWVGPKEYPEKSKARLINWLNFHPDWQLYFWCDREDIILPHARAVKKEAYVLERLKPYYQKATNYGEMSDLIRISILYDLGGLYFDHDMDCIRRIDPITENCDFMIACEFPGGCAEFLYLDPVTMQTQRASYTLSNALIASSPKHPVWEKIFECIDQDYAYFSSHPDLSPHEKTLHRTYLPITKGVMRFDPRKHPSFALLPALFHAPVSAIRMGEAMFTQIEGWIFVCNYYEGLWKTNTMIKHE